jgi:hypothetical protein
MPVAYEVNDCAIFVSLHPTWRVLGEFFIVSFVTKTDAFRAVNGWPGGDSEQARSDVQPV